MGRPSKMERCPFKEDVLRLNTQGYSNNYIAQYLCDKGFSITHGSVAKWLAENGKASKHEGSGNRFTSDKTAKLTEDRKTDKETQLDPIIVDFEAIAKRFDIPDNLNSPEGIIGVCQKLSAQIFLLESAILHTRLEKHAKGECKHPSEQIKGYRVCMEVLSKAWGLENVIDVSQAMKTLESEGYRIEAVDIIESQKAKEQDP